MLWCSADAWCADNMAAADVSKLRLHDDSEFPPMSHTRHDSWVGMPRVNLSLRDWLAVELYCTLACDGLVVLYVGVWQVAGVLFDAYD